MNNIKLGCQKIFLDEVDSTNNYTSELIRQSVISEGDIVYTSNQINGRGQRGNSWKSEPFANLAMSLFLKPIFIPIEQQFSLNKWVTLSLIDAINELTDVKSRVKWPNDIYVDDCKIAGILIENSIMSTKINNSIIGIGLNINQVNFGELKHATSLKLISNKLFNIENVLDTLVRHLNKSYIAFQQNYNVYDAAFIQNLYLYEEWRNYKIGNSIELAKIKGINKRGQLQLEHSSGMVKEYSLQEVSLSL